jgi:hypothetical protein
MTRTVPNRLSAWAARFLNSRDLAMQSILIETATNNSPGQGGASHPGTARELVSLERAGPQRR